MTDLVLRDRAPAARVSSDAVRREPAAVILGQDSGAIGCAPSPGTLRWQTVRLRARRAWTHALPTHGWRDVAAAWLLTAAAILAVAGWLAFPR